MSTITVPSFVTIRVTVRRWRVVKVGVSASGGCGCEGRVEELLQAAGDDVDGLVGEGNVG